MTTPVSISSAPDAPGRYDWGSLLERLNSSLRLRTTPIGMKLFKTVTEMEAIPKIRRPTGALHTTDQIVGQASRLGWTVGITAADLVGPQCSAVIGLSAQDDDWLSGTIGNCDSSNVKTFDRIWRFGESIDATKDKCRVTQIKLRKPTN